MRSRLQLDVRNLSLGRRHPVNAYEVKAGIGVIEGNTVWSMLRLGATAIHFTFTFISVSYHWNKKSGNLSQSHHYADKLVLVKSE